MAESEKFTVSGSDLVEKVKQLIHEGNIRRVRVIHKGKTVIPFQTDNVVLSGVEHFLVALVGEEVTQG